MMIKSSGDANDVSSGVNFGLYGLISISLSANHNWNEENVVNRSAMEAIATHHWIFRLLFAQRGQRFHQGLVDVLFEIVLGWLSDWDGFDDA